MYVYIYRHSVRNSRARTVICYSKLNLISKFRAKVATHLPHVYLEYYIMIIAIQLLQIAIQLNHD